MIKILYWMIGEWADYPVTMVEMFLLFVKGTPRWGWWSDSKGIKRYFYYNPRERRRIMNLPYLGSIYGVTIYNSMSMLVHNAYACARVAPE